MGMLLCILKTNIIFRGIVVGRKVISLRICTCPKRDMQNEESQDQNSGEVDDKGKKERQDQNDEQEFWVLARGRTTFNALNGLGEFLEVNRAGGNVESYKEAVNRKNHLVKLSGKKRKIDKGNNSQVHK